MSGVQSKITTHTKEQGNVIHRGKKLSIEWPKMVQILDFADKDFKGAIINISKR